MIEKHFTDDASRLGPDHKFSMDPGSWREMVDRTRELENALGCGVKQIEDNEKETVVIQRRSIRANGIIGSGVRLTRENLSVLRPSPEDGLAPYFLNDLIGKKTIRQISSGEHIRWSDLE